MIFEKSTYANLRLFSSIRYFVTKRRKTCAVFSSQQTSVFSLSRVVLPSKICVFSPPKICIFSPSKICVSLPPKRRRRKEEEYRYFAAKHEMAQISHHTYKCVICHNLRGCVSLIRSCRIRIKTVLTVYHTTKMAYAKSVASPDGTR